MTNKKYDIRVGSILAGRDVVMTDDIMAVAKELAAVVKERISETKRANAAEKQLATTTEAAEALITKMRHVYETEEYRRVWQTAQIHNGQYTGEKWSKELDNLEALIIRHRETQ